MLVLCAVWITRPSLCDAMDHIGKPLGAAESSGAKLSIQGRKLRYWVRFGARFWVSDYRFRWVVKCWAKPATSLLLLNE